LHEPLKYLMPEEFRRILEKTVLRHSSAPLSLLIVPDVAAWAKEANVSVVGNPMATSIQATPQFPRRVVIREVISRDEIEGVLSLLDFQGYADEVRGLRDNPERFATHLVLHELAHLENNWGQEREMDCDDWAFQRLPQ
jgi:hypothetical protein